jgi:hypothetical protein
LEWLGDCITALKPQKIVRVQASQRWLVPLKDPHATQQKFAEEFPGFETLLKPEFTSAYSGTTFNVPFFQGSVRDCLFTSQIGVTRPNQPFGWSKKSELDSTSCLGFFFDMLKIDESGIDNSTNLLSELSERLTDESQFIIRTTTSRFNLSA